MPPCHHAATFINLSFLKGGGYTATHPQLGGFAV
jgi:hypothetical protein